MPASAFPATPAVARVTRRRVLHVGGLGVVGLGLPELLWADKQEAWRLKSTATSCIFIFQFGGPSHIDTFDPKPQTPAGIRGPYKSIATSVPGMQVTNMLPRLSRLADRYSLIRSLNHKHRQHNGALQTCLTGRLEHDARTPFLGSVIAQQRPAEGNIPSYVWLQNMTAGFESNYLSGGFLGSTYAPMLVGEDFDNPSKPGFRVKAFDPTEGLTANRLESRFRLLKRIERPESPLLQSEPGASFQRFQEQALDLVTGPNVRRAFDVTEEHQNVRDRYGRGPLGQNLLLARRLIEAGVRLVTVNAWCGLAPGYDFLNHTQSWDHHGAAVQKCGIFSNGTFGLGFALPQFDAAVSALLEELDERGLLSTTLVVAVGEFGRTPKISTKPYAGRHHWPDCYCALLAGGGIRGGAILGSSDKSGAYVKNRPVSPEDFGATIFQTLGVPPETRFVPQNPTLRISDGQPIEELFA